MTSFCCEQYFSNSWIIHPIRHLVFIKPWIPSQLPSRINTEGDKDTKMLKPSQRAQLSTYLEPLLRFWKQTFWVIAKAQNQHILYNMINLSVCRCTDPSFTPQSVSALICVRVRVCPPFLLEGEGWLRTLGMRASLLSWVFFSAWLTGAFL